MVTGDFIFYSLGRARYTPFMDRRRIESISKALADKTRLLIFEAIHNRKEMNCGEIVSLRGVTPATVSHHLRILNNAGLIECRRVGQFVYSTTNPKVLNAYTKALTALGGKHKNKK
jgi:ArsR family transcriptional regulator, arsenate/arsenite/antimonite-responsive transcriptional repressor